MPRGTETVLIAEDEAGVRTLVREILGGLGYTILEAGDGVEALQVGEQYQGPIHLLVTDVVMPRMNGRLLAQHLQTQRPNLKVLFVSGYTDDAILHHGVRHETAAFLQKPFRPSDLGRKIRQLLDQN